MEIGRKDLLWNYAATSMRIVSGLVVMPITLHLFSSEEIGLWGIFTSLVTITLLLDFGFSNSFSRNISYVYSGVKELRREGYSVVDTMEIDYGLLKNLLLAIKRYYGIMALIFILIFFIGGPFYLSKVLVQYSGEPQPIWVAWFFFGGALAYELYTYCYNTILVGRGLVKKSMQIVVISQSVRIIVTVVLLFFDLGIISLVFGLLSGDIVNRSLAYRAFYDRKTKKLLAKESATQGWMLIKTLAPNSLKIGFTSLSTFIRNQATLLVAPIFLSLSQIANYSISKQLISVISTLGLAWYYTFYSKTAQYRVRDDKEGVKRLYIKGIVNLILIFIVGGTLLLLLGIPFFHFIRSQTALLSNSLLLMMLLFSFLECVQLMANGTLMAKNEVPFYRADIVSGICSFLLLLLMFFYTSLGVLSLILSTGLVMCAYMNWKVPISLIKEIGLRWKDCVFVVFSYFKKR